MKKSGKKIIIIGAGFGGLSAGALLAKDGHEVHVFEKNEQAGGRASVLEEDGFRFDMGPSWYMMPDVFEKFFAEFGKKSSDYYALSALKPQYRVYWSDGTKIDISGNIEKDKKMLEKFEPGFSAQFDKYLQESQQKYEIAINSVLYKNMDSPLDLMSLEMAKNGRHMGIFSPMHKYISRFFKHPKIQQLLEYNLVFLGCSPHNAPSLFSLMTHVDFNLGVWYPTGGIGKVVEAFEKIGKEHGVQFHYNKPVEKILVDGNKTSGIVVDGKIIEADIVISNGDYWFTENLLSDQTKRTYSQSYWEKKTMTPSAFLLYLGVKGKLPKLEHHTLYFGDSWEGHFKDVFEHKRWPLDPSIYINKTSQNDPTVAPKNHENLMVLVPISAGIEETPLWREQYAKYIISFIEEKMDMKLSDKIVYKKIFSVSDFETRYNSYKGNALGGLAHTFFQSAVWRPSNKSKNLSNLFFAGANTVPGIGVPPAIISGHLVRDRVRKMLTSK